MSTKGPDPEGLQAGTVRAAKGLGRGAMEKVLLEIAGDAGTHPAQVRGLQGGQQG